MFIQTGDTWRIRHTSVLCVTVNLSVGEKHVGPARDGREERMEPLRARLRRLPTARIRWSVSVLHISGRKNSAAVEGGKQKEKKKKPDGEQDEKARNTGNKTVRRDRSRGKSRESSVGHSAAPTPVPAPPYPCLCEFTAPRLFVRC